MSSHQKNIAIVTELEWPLRRHYELVTGIQNYAAEHENWNLEVSRFPEVQMEAGKRYDGVIGRIEPETYEAACKAGIPIVNVMLSSNIRDHVHNVIVDTDRGEEMAATHLLKRGMTKLISVRLRGQLDASRPSTALQAFAKTHDIPCRSTDLPRNVEESADNWRITRERLKEVLKGWQPPVGILTVTDVAARIVIAMLGDLGWRVPEDVAVVGRGNEETTCTAIHPTISSVDMGYVRNGYEAAEVLARIIRGETVSEKIQWTPPKGLVVRGSSDVFPVRDPEVHRALRYMAYNSDHPISVSDIVTAANVGRQTLERRFRKELNTTIYAELHRLRIERAKRLLVEDRRLPIKEISKMAGFSTMSNFYAAFKKQTDKSPAKYREDHADPIEW